MHSAKQAIRNKSVRFGYKNFVFASSDGYPYILIPYTGAKGVGGTPGKVLTLRVVTELVLKLYEGLVNLTFDNWYSSSKLISLVTALDIPTTCTARVDCVGHAPILSNTQIEKHDRGYFSYAFDNSLALHGVK